jgi:hypothetical protein
MAYARRLDVYGYMIVYKPTRGLDPEQWIVDQDDEYANLPAHYMTAEEALDRVAFLRSRNIEARVAALMAEPTDDAEEFEASRNGPNAS